MNAFGVFFESKITMREGLIRVLEQKIDPMKLAQQNRDIIKVEDQVDDLPLQEIIDQDEQSSKLLKSKEELIKAENEINERRRSSRL